VAVVNQLACANLLRVVASAWSVGPWTHRSYAASEPFFRRRAWQVALPFVGPSFPDMLQVYPDRGPVRAETPAGSPVPGGSDPLGDPNPPPPVLPPPDDPTADAPPVQEPPAPQPPEPPPPGMPIEPPQRQPAQKVRSRPRMTTGAPIMR
jgi:hypothetical protein